MLIWFKNCGVRKTLESLKLNIYFKRLRTCFCFTIKGFFMTIFASCWGFQRGPDFLKFLNTFPFLFGFLYNSFATLGPCLFEQISFWSGNGLNFICCGFLSGTLSFGFNTVVYLFSNKCIGALTAFLWLSCKCVTLSVTSCLCRWSKCWNKNFSWFLLSCNKFFVRLLSLVWVF